MWGFCGCNRRREEPVREVREYTSVRRPCCNKNDESDRNQVSPSSFCEQQLAAARNSCKANPFSNFSGCNN